MHRGRLKTIGANLTYIMAELRAVGGSKVRIIGMTYYVPELAAWLTGPAGQQSAQLSEQLAVTFNGVLSQVYQAFGARIADVFSAFHSSDFHPSGDAAGHRNGAAQRGTDLSVDMGVRTAAARAQRAREQDRLPGHRPNLLVC